MHMMNVVVVTMMCFLCMHATDDALQGIPAQVAEEKDGTGVDFFSLFAATIEDGFFGGAKWGVAAAFYHALYSIMGLTMFTVPKAVSSLVRMYMQWRDRYLGRAPLLEIHELQVLSELLSEALKEYEDIDIELYNNHFCTVLPINTLSAVIKHVHEYIYMRLERYKDTVSDKEILFFLQLIIHTIDGILACIENVNYRTEIIVTTKTTIVIMNKLILLLQGPLYDRELHDPTSAWFSGKGKFYVLSY